MPKPKATANRLTLTDRTLLKKDLEPGLLWDTLVRGLAVRVSDRGRRSFYAVRRRAKARNPTWVRLGAYPVMTLAEARAKAREALGALDAGDDPATLAAAKRRAAEEADRQRTASTFGAIAELFIQQHLPRLRTARANEALIRRELIPVLGDKPIGEIRRRDIIELCKRVAARGVVEPDRRRPESGGRSAARKTYAAVSSLFNWAGAMDIEGLVANPIAGLKPGNVLDPVPARDRTLDDAEIRAVWRASSAMGQPFGALLQVLLLTGQRLNEIARCRWSEIDGFDGDRPVLIIPAERMKGTNGKAAAHSVPLTAAVVTILRGLPRFGGGDFVFTTRAGRRPVSGFSKAAAETRKLAGIAPWQVHDLRRTARSRLSELGVATMLAELVIGHRQSGILAVYDRHRFDDEKRTALEAWEAKLLSIVAPEPPAGEAANVVQMRARA